MSGASSPRVAVIIPVLNEATGIGSTIQHLRALGFEEVRVVDGGSTDETCANARAHGVTVIETGRGRARQMNAGAADCKADVLLFLHADTTLPANAHQTLAAFADATTPWGRFDVRLSGDQLAFRVIEWCMNWRSRLTGIATGDQAIFVRRNVFQTVGGFTEIPLMEDVEISRRLRRVGAPYCVRDPVLTSSRRWEARGILPTVWLMWRLRLLYFVGVDPGKLARLYR